MFLICVNPSTVYTPLDPLQHKSLKDFKPMAYDRLCNVLCLGLKVSKERPSLAYWTISLAQLRLEVIIVFKFYTLHDSSILQCKHNTWLLRSRGPKSYNKFVSCSSCLFARGLISVGQCKQELYVVKVTVKALLTQCDVVVDAYDWK